MKKAIMVLTLLVMLSPSAYAKTSRQVISELSIEGIVTNTATAIGFVVKNSLKLLCTPFYWAEQVKK